MAPTFCSLQAEAPSTANDGMCVSWRRQHLFLNPPWDILDKVLHKIVEGGTDRSYGIQVARLAGVPTSLVERAKQILRTLEAGADRGALPGRAAQAVDAPEGTQLGLFDGEPSRVELALEDIDPDALSPIDALLALRQLKALLDESRA